MKIELRKVLSVADDCLQSRARLKGIMRDLYPEEKRDVNILLNAFESGIPSRIAKQGNLSAADYKRYIKTIVEDYAMQEYYAIEALDAWIDVFLGDGTAERVKGNTPITPSKPKTSDPKPATVPTPVIAPQNPVVKQPTSDVSLFSFKELNDGYAIIKFLGFDEDIITLPDIYNGKPVCRVADSAFKDCLTIKRVYMGKNIKILETDCFKGCDKLESVYGCENIEYIGDCSFCACTNLSEIQISDTILYLGKMAFSNTALTHFEIPKSIDYISAYLLSKCTKLKSVNIHDRVFALGEGCFMGCTKLMDVVVPAGVKSIGSHAFLNCTGLKNLTIESQDAKFDGLVIKESYIWQPDRRYNPKTKYRNLSNITVQCRPGSTAQMYCRNQDIACTKLDWSGNIPHTGDLSDAIGIWVKMSFIDTVKQKKYKAIAAIEKLEDVIVEHKRDESYIIFRNPAKITKPIIDSLLLADYEKDQRWESFAIPFSKGRMLTLNVRR